MHTERMYVVRKAVGRPGLDGQWDGAAWGGADTLTVGSFHRESSDHHPLTQARMVYDDEGVYGIFRVEDRYVLCTHTEYLSDVSRDACVEFFVEPKPGKGYLNFEMNCGGVMLASYIEDCTRIDDPARPDQTFEKYTRLPWDVASQVAVYHSMPAVVATEIEDPVEWVLEFHIPFSVLETYVGPLGEVAGQRWRANFNKCAEDCSHPHWATWSPIGPELNFHRPDCFAPITFAR